MPGKREAGAPWQALEEQAWHAWREWPLWLVLRERELGERLAAVRPERRTAGAARAAEGNERRSGAEGEQA
jgi:hypothetical protein